MCIWLLNTHLAQFWARQHGIKVTCQCKHCLKAGCMCVQEGGREMAKLSPTQLQAPNSHDVPQNGALAVAAFMGFHSHSCQQTEVNSRQTLLCRRWISFICNLWQFLLFLAQKTCWRSLPSSAGTIKNKESLSIPFEVQFAAVKLQEN